MNTSELFDTFERALEQVSPEGACCYLAFFALDEKSFKLIEKKIDPNFFEPFYLKAKKICEEEIHRYFPSVAAVENIAVAQKNWQEYIHHAAKHFLSENYPTFQFSTSILRMIAADAITFYEWINDVGYLNGDSIKREIWMEESPLNKFFK